MEEYWDSGGALREGSGGRGLVGVVGAIEVRALRADIADRDAHGSRQLVLDVEVPLLHIAVAERIFHPGGAGNGGAARSPPPYGLARLMFGMPLVLWLKLKPVRNGAVRAEFRITLSSLTSQNRP